MKKVLFALLLLFATTSFSMMAQNKIQNAKQEDRSKAQNIVQEVKQVDPSNARIEVRQGKQCLVLTTDTFISEELSVITLFIDEETLRILDDLLAGPKGATAKMKDSRGTIVNVALANVNSQTGLMFTSGSKCIAITKDEYEGLKEGIEAL